MKKEFSSSASWNSAAVAGLVMGIATIILDYLPTLTLAIGLKGFLGSVLVFLIKIAKIVACVYVFRLMMLRFFNTYETDYARLQRFWPENRFVLIPYRCRILSPADACHQSGDNDTGDPGSPELLPEHNGFKHYGGHGEDVLETPGYHFRFLSNLLLPMGLATFYNLCQKTLPDRPVRGSRTRKRKHRHSISHGIF